MGKRTSLISLLEKLTNDLGFWKSLFMGLFISASGSMVIGALHLIAIQISMERGVVSAILFSTGCAVMEAIFVYFLGNFVRWLGSKKNGLRGMEWTLLLLFLALSIGSFYAAFHISPDVEAVITPNILMPTFILGMTIRLLYPSMIPFWMAWNAVLVTRKVQFNLFAFAIGTAIATLAMHALYILAGQFVLDFLENESRWMLILIGFLFLITAGVQARGMFWKR